MVFDKIRALLGTNAATEATREAQPDVLLDLSSVHLTLETKTNATPLKKAGLGFSSVQTAEFENLVTEVEDVLETGTEHAEDVEIVKDNRGTDWFVVTDEMFETLVSQMYYATNVLTDNNYGSRLLAAVFCFEMGGQTAYLIYSFNRGRYYPFVPRAGRERDGQQELRIEAALDDELTMEEETQHKRAIWPRSPGDYPWE